MTICDFEDPHPYNLVDIAREIAEFEAKLAKELADKAAQEIMAEIEFEAKAKLPNTVCEKTEGEGSYLTYISGVVNSADEL